MDKLLPVLLGIAIIAVFLWPRGKMGADNSSTKSEKKLLSRCLGDKDMMERLIDREMKRDASLSREVAARDAIESHRRDNR